MRIPRLPLQIVIAITISLHSANQCLAEDRNVNFGPGFTEFDNQFPLALNHNSFRPMSPATLMAGEYSLSTSLAVSNTFIARENRYTLDGEYSVSTLGAKYGVTNHWEISGRIPLIWRNGGIMDSAIDDFHHTFGFKRGKRRDYKDDKFEISGINDDGSEFSITKKTHGIGDLVIGSKYLLTPGVRSSAWSLVSELRLPTAGPDGFGQDSVDLTIGAVGSRRIDPFVAYWGAAYIYYGDTSLEGIAYSQNHLEGFVGADYSITDALSLNLAFYGSSKLLNEVRDFPHYAVYCDTGLKYNISAATTLGFTIRENPTPANGTTDITFVLGLEKRFSS